MKAKALLVSIAVFGFGVSSLAAEFTGQIEFVSSDKSRITVSSEDTLSLKEGSSLSSDQNCTFNVRKSTAKKAILTVQKCKDRSELTKGNIIVLSSETSSSAAVQEPISQSEPEFKVYKPYSGMVAQGFRIDLIKAFLDVKLEVGGLGSDSEDADQEIGLGIGYAYIPVGSMGFLGRLVHTKFDEGAKSLRLDGNVTYGLNQNGYIFGGLNLHDYTNDELEDMDVGFGFQVGGGFQLTQNFGINLSYVIMNNDASINGYDFELELKGFELSLNATF